MLPHAAPLARPSLRQPGLSSSNPCAAFTAACVRLPHPRDSVPNTFPWPCSPRRGTASVQNLLTDAKAWGVPHLGAQQRGHRNVMVHAGGWL